MGTNKNQAKGMSRLADFANTFEGKALAVFVAAILVISMLNISAFAEIDKSGDKNTDPVEMPNSSAVETTEQVEVEVGEALVTFKYENAYAVIVGKSGNEQVHVAKDLVVEEGKDFSFKVMPDTGSAFDLTDPNKGVTAKNVSTGSEVPVKQKDDTFTIEGKYVDSNLEITIRAHAITQEEPSAEATPIVDNTTTDTPIANTPASEELASDDLAEDAPILDDPANPADLDPTIDPADTFDSQKPDTEDIDAPQPESIDETTQEEPTDNSIASAVGGFFGTMRASVVTAFSESSWTTSDFIVSGNKVTGLTEQGYEKLTSQEEGLKVVKIPTIAGVSIVDSGFNNLTINRLIIDSGYTTISDNAFQNGSLREVLLPATLASIGQNAFAGNEIVSLNLENTAITTLGKAAFRDNRLESIITPDSLTTIEAETFANNRLSSATLSKVSDIKDAAFYGNELTSIELPAIAAIAESAFDSNKRVVAITAPTQLESSFRAGSGYIINPVTMTIIRVDKKGERVAADVEIGSDYTSDNLYPNGKTVDVVAPALADYAIVGETGNIQTVEAQQGKEITFVYADVKSTVSITVPAKIYSMGPTVTEAQLLEGVTAVSNYDGSPAISITVSPNTIEADAIKNVTVTYKATDQYGNLGVASVVVKIIESPELAYVDGFWQYRDFAYSGGVVTGLSDYGKEKYAANPTKGNYLSLPGVNPENMQPVTKVGTGAMTDFPKGITTLDFSDCSSVEEIAERAFQNDYKALERIVFSNNSSLTTIGYQAFSFCTALESVDLSNCTALASIDRAFQGCTSIASVDFSGCTSLTSLSWALYGCTSLEFADLSGCTSLTSLESTFFGCTSLKSVDLSGCSALDSMQWVFYGCISLESVDLSSLTALTSLTASFRGCTGLKSVDLSNCVNLTDIVSAFYNCTSLKSVDLSSLTKLTSIDSAFYNCTSLKSVDLSSLTKLTSIDSAFYNCKSLESIDLSDCSSLSSIGDSAFKSCGSLKSVDLTNLSAITSIGDSAFYQCGNLQSIDLWNLSALSTVGAKAFYACRTIQSVDFSNCPDLKSIEQSAFFDCYALQSVDFSGCTSLETIGILTDKDENSDEEFGVFGYCDRLRSIDFSGCSSLSYIGDYSFFSNYSLQSVNFSGCTALTAIGKLAFVDCGELKYADISSCTALSYFATAAFGGCYELPTIDFSKFTSVSYIGDWAFNSCSNFRSVDLSGQTALTSIGAGAFSSCDKLQSIDLSGCTALKIIGDNAFGEGYPSTQSVNLTGCTALTSIGKGAFSKCTYLSQDTLDLSANDNFKNIGRGAFASANLSAIYIGGISSDYGLTNLYGERSLYGDPVITAQNSLLPVFIEGNRQNVQNAPGYVINPVSVTVHCVDKETGEKVRSDKTVMLTAPCTEEEIKAPQVFGCTPVDNTPQKISADYEPVIQTREVTFEYVKNQDLQNHGTITQEDLTNYNVVGKNGLGKIGSDLFKTSTKVTLDGGDTFKDKQLWVYYDPARITLSEHDFSQLGTVDVSEPGVLKMVFDSNRTQNTGNYAGVTLAWKLQKGPTEENLGQPISAELITVENNTESIISQTESNQVVYLKGYYNRASLSVLGQIYNDSSSGSAEEANKTAKASFTMSTQPMFERSIESVTFTVVPAKYTYVKDDGTTEQRAAELSKEAAKYWIDNKDGTYTLSRSGLCSMTSQTATIEFEVPNIQSRTQFSVQTSYVATPHQMADTEYPFSGSATTRVSISSSKNIFFKNNAGKIYDNEANKNKEFEWEVGLELRHLDKNIVELNDIIFKDYKLDDLMHYTRILPRTFETIRVKAYQTENDSDTVIFDETSSTEVVFPENLYDKISYITVEQVGTIDTELDKRKQAYFSVFAKFDDPSSIAYDKTDSSKNFFGNYAQVISGTQTTTDGSTTQFKVPASEQEQVGVLELRPLQASIGLNKSISGAINENAQYKQGDRIIYGLSVSTQGEDGFCLYDVELQDEIPEYLVNGTFTPSSRLVEATTDLEYKIVEGSKPYGGGKLVITASSLDLHALGSNGIGSISAYVDDTAPDSKSLQNTAYIKASKDPNDDITFLGVTKDNPIDNTVDVMSATTSYAETLADELLRGVKYIRTHATGSSEWGAWTPGETKTSSEEPFQYRILAQNNTSAHVSDIVVYDILPYVGDTAIKDANISRESQFANTPVSLECSSNGKAFYTKDDVKTIDALEKANWIEYNVDDPEFAYATAIKIVSNPGEKLEKEDALEAIVTMQTPKITSESMLGQKAFNSFVYKIGGASNYTESETACNELVAKGSVEVSKVNPKGDNLEGAEFYLYDAQGTLLAKKKSDSDGKIVFDNLEVGKYTLHENVAPDGYELLTDDVVVTKDDFNYDSETASYVAKKTIVNDPTPARGTLRIQKLDGDSNSLAGVTFTVSSNANSIEPQTKTTDESGLLLFSGLPVGVYTITEVSAPGNLKLVQKFSVSVLEDKVNMWANNMEAVKMSPSDPTTVIVKNARADVDVYKLGMRFNTKYDKEATMLTPKDGTLLQNVTLKLYKIEGTSEKYVSTHTTEWDGKVSLSDLEVGTTYFLEEDEATVPLGYERAARTYFSVDCNGVIKDKDGTTYKSGAVIVKDMPKRAVNLYKLGILSENHKNTAETKLTLNDGVRLEGAQFEVYKRPTTDSGITLTDDWTLVDEYTTNSGGFAIDYFSVDTLYCVVEKQGTAPEGYVYSDAKVYFMAKVGDNNSVTLVNEKGDEYANQNVMFKNYPETLDKTLEIEKIDYGTGVGLGGAVFKLEKRLPDTKDAEGNVVENYETIDDNITTDPDGTAKVEHLDRGAYRLTEIVAPGEYLRTGRTEIFTIDEKTDKISFTGDASFKNVKLEPKVVKGDYVGSYIVGDAEDKDRMNIAINYIEQTLKRTAHVMRVSSTQTVLLAGLGGAEFKLEEKKVDTTTQSWTIESDEKGEFDFASLAGFSWKEDSIYTFTETKAPVGYEPLATSYVFDPSSERASMDSMGGKWIALENKVKTHRILISKVSSATGQALGDVDFTLYHPDKTVAKEVATNASGLVEISDLAPGTYYLAETKAANGYELLQGYYRIIITGEKDISDSAPINYEDKIAPNDSMDNIIAEYKDAGSIAVRAYNDSNNAPALTLKKKIVGTPTTSSPKEFTFTIQVENSSGTYVDYSGPYKFYQSDESTSWQAKVTNNGKVTLEDGQHITIKSLGDNTRFRITEDTSAATFDYEVSYTIDSGNQIVDTAIEGATHAGETMVVCSNEVPSKPVVTKSNNKQNAAGKGDTVKVGDIITYSIDVMNENKTNIDGLWVRDYIPAGTDFVSLDEEGVKRYQATFVNKAGSPFIDWFIDTIAPGQTVRLNFTVAVNSDARNTIDNTALYQVLGSDPKPNTDPDQKTNKVTNPLFNNDLLQVSKQTQLTDNSWGIKGNDVNVGDEIVYRIVVANKSKADMTGIWVRDFVPEYTEFVSFKSKAHNANVGVNENGAYVDWFIDRIVQGGAAELTFTVKVVKDSEGKVVTNEALYEFVGGTSKDHDPVKTTDPSNKTNEVTTKVKEKGTDPVVPTPVEPTPVTPTPSTPTPVEPTPIIPTPVEPTPVEPTPITSPLATPAAAIIVQAIPDVITQLGALTEPFEQMIADEDTPLAGLGKSCWVHYYIMAGLLITAVYSISVLVRRRKFIGDLAKQEETVLEGDLEPTLLNKAKEQVYDGMIVEGTETA